MSTRTRCWLAGLALIFGGILAGISHVYHLEPPSDPAQLAQFARLSQPIHLLLFAGGILVLLGWFGQYGLQSSHSGVTGLFAFVSVFLGILLGDVLHCILEFSVFPVLSSSVPYALPALARATYRTTPLAFLLKAGQLMILAGVPAAAYFILRIRALPAWTALPFGITAVLLGWGMTIRSAITIGSVAYIALYCSMVITGVAVIWAARPSVSPCVESEPGARTSRS